MILDIALLIIFSTFVLTALIARLTHLPITALEILAGIGLSAGFAFHLPDGAIALTTLGSLFIVFLAGLETRWDYLRAHIGKALGIGLPAFLGPFFLLLGTLDLGLHLPLLLSIIGATALADTSISIVYTTLHQYDLADLPFGRLVLASTLMVNLAEDTTVTTATLLHGPALLVTALLLAALAAVAIGLPRLGRHVAPRFPPTFTNLGTRSLLLALILLGTLSALVSVPGILFVFLMGLLVSQYAGRGFVDDVQKFAFALFVPVYFLAVGLEVDAGFVLAHLELLLALGALATIGKVLSVLPGLRRSFEGRHLRGVTALFNTRLTSATVILLLALNLGLIPEKWYSIFISVVVLLALGSSAVMRSFAPFRRPGAGPLASGPPALRPAGAARAPSEP